MKSLIQGFLTGARGQARALAPRLAISPRFSRHLNTPREISPLWGQIPHLSVQVPPRTRQIPISCCFWACWDVARLWASATAGRPAVLACSFLLYGGFRPRQLSPGVRSARKGRARRRERSGGLKAEGGCDLGGVAGDGLPDQVRGEAAPVDL